MSEPIMHTTNPTISKIRLNHIKGPKNLNGCKIYMMSYMITNRIMPCSTGYCIRPINRRWVLHKTKSCGKQLNCHWLQEISYCRVGSQTMYYMFHIVHKICCGPSIWSTFTILEGPSTAKPFFYFPRRGLAFCSAFGWFSWSQLLVHV